MALRVADIAPKRLQRYEDCGKRAWVQYSPSRQSWRLSHESCGLRVCPLCALRAHARTRTRIDQLLSHADRRRLKMITLTLRSSNAPLRQQIDRLLKSFRRLRQRRIWRAVEWGLAVMEITRNTDTGQWHPHLHLLCVSDYIPQGELSWHWKRCTGDSPIVDIRAVKDVPGAIHEIAKYASKPCAFANYSDNPSAGAEYFRAISNKRTLIEFGAWPKSRLEKPPSDQGEDDWSSVMPLGELLTLYDQQDAEAALIIRYLGIPRRTLDRWMRAIRAP